MTTITTTIMNTAKPATHRVAWHAHHHHHDDDVKSFVFKV